jgi:hypothetical protein
VIDVKLTDDGDIAIETARGDIALTGYSSLPSDLDTAVCLTQMAKMSLRTEKGDLLTDTRLGNELNSLMGLPNKPATAARGEQLIRAALRSWGVTNKVTIETWPVDATTIGYEIKIELTPGGRELTFTINQGLTALQ